MIDQLRKKDSPNAKIIYILKGDPTYMEVMRFNSGSFMESTKQKRLKDQISIASQHENECKDYKRPIGLHLTFYFPLPIRETHKMNGKKKDDYYHARPYLANCIKYIESLLENVVYKDSGVIASIQAEKKFDEDPRTEFYFVEL